MEIQEAADHVHACPSRLQIALALAVLKTKPDGVAVREYILQLREHLRPGRRPSHSTTEDCHRHLDQIAYWRSRFEECNQRCHELERRNLQLERRQASDEDDTGLEIRMDSDADQSTSKRKRASSTSSGPCKRAKGRKPQASNTLSRSTVNRDLDAADTPSDSKALRSPQLEEIAKAKEELAVRLYVTYNLYKQEAKSSMMSSAIMNHDKLASESPMRDRSELAMAIQASTRAWACLIVGLKKLSDGVEISLPRLVIVECVNMFNTLFNSISVCARQMANSQAASRFRGGTSGREADPTSREIGIFRSAAQFLNALISSLNKDDCHHRDIFEGVLFLLIERIGNNLFYFTFNHRRKPTIEGDIAMSAELELDRNGPSQSTEIISLRLEVQCLTPVLERAMGLAPYHMNMPTSSRPSSASSRRPSSATRSPTKALPRASAVPLVTHARNRLQRTLIQSMFGETQDDELSDVLRKPGRIGPMPKFSKIEENDVGDWFTREIWRVLGWSIISNESEV